MSAPSRLGSTPRGRAVSAGSRGRPLVEVVGGYVEQLAVLVSAGVAPVQAWGYLAETADEPLIHEVAAAARRGTPVSDAILVSLGGHRSPRRRHLGQGSRLVQEEGADAAWRSLAVAWFVATESGAPMRRCLGDIAAALQAVGGVERETTAALAGPAATTRLVLVLPLVSVGGGGLMGLDTLGALFGTPAGVVCLLSGLLLMALGRAWSTRLLRRARRVGPTPGLSLDLIAVAIGGGGSLSDARSLAVEATARFGLRPRSSVDPDEPAISTVLTLASRSGAPPALLLRSEAVRIRRDAIGAAQNRAASLGVWLMLPLGLCVLPAFILLAVVPVLLGVLTAAPFP